MLQWDSSYEYNMLFKQLKEFDLQQYTGELYQRGYKSALQLAQQSVEQQEIVFQEINVPSGDKQRFKDIFKYLIENEQIIKTLNQQKNKSDNSQPETYKIIGRVQLPILQQSKSETITFEGIINKVILQELKNKDQIFDRTFDKISLNLRVPKIRIHDINVETQSISFLVNYNSNDFDSEKMKQDIKQQFVDQLTIYKCKIDFDDFLTFLFEKDYEFEEKFQVIVKLDKEVIIIGLESNIDEFKSYVNQMELQKQQIRKIHTIEVSNRLIFKRLNRLYSEEQLDLDNQTQIVFTQENKIQLTSQKQQLQNDISTINKMISEIESQLKTTSSEFSRRYINYIYKNLQTMISQLEEQQEILINFQEGELRNLEERVILRKNQFRRSFCLMTVQSFDENLNKEIICFLGAEVRKCINRLKLIIPNISQYNLNQFKNMIESLSIKVIGQVSCGNLIIIEIFRNKESKIQQFLDQISNCVTQIPKEWEQYEQLSHNNTQIYTFDLLCIKDNQKMKIEMPVVTNKCKPHPRSCLTFIDACNQLAQNNQIVCQCGESVNQLNDLVKDIRQQAYEQFHPTVEQVQIIQGLLFHKYNRKNKYTEQISKADQIMASFLQIIYSKNESSNCISDIIKNTIGIGKKIEFYAYCLLDKVKIIIPVRIMNCQHLECYELTSLLDYQFKAREQQNYSFQCIHPKCRQTLTMETLQTMIEGLVIDVELLKVLNKGFPSQIKFIYEPITNQFSDGMQIVNGVQIDPLILRCYEEMATADDQKAINYIEFQQQIQKLVAQVMQCEVPAAIGKILKLWEYDIIQLKEQFTNQVLEFPIRCIECKDYNQFIDCRNFAAHYVLTKRKCQSKIKCLLCGFEQNCLTKSICNLIYYDQNLISQMVLEQKENQQYSTLPEFDKMSLEYFEVLDIKYKIKEPILLKGCKHFKIQCLTYTEAKDQWEAKKEVICTCGKKTNNLYDLIKDIRAQVYEQFHPSVEFVQIVFGIFTHKYQRKRRFTDYLQEAFASIPTYVLAMKNKYHQSCSISSIINLKYGSWDYVFYALCLLDQVKIIFPVRFINCYHPECYELTSLLAYYYEVEKAQYNYEAKMNFQFQCVYPGCFTYQKFYSLDDFLQGLYLDIELLELLNKCEPSQFKFVFLTKKKQFNLEIANVEYSVLKQLYEQNLTEQQRDDRDLQGFIQQIKNLTAQIIQLDILKNQQKILKQEKYHTKIINLIDPITQQQIEFPVRCTQCKQHDRCVDVRTFAASHILAKIRKQPFNKCPLCGSEYKYLFNLTCCIIYYDQNQIFRMLVDPKYPKQLQNEEFKYEGRQYLLEWFKNCQKIKREDFLFQLQANTNSTVVDFSLERWWCTCDSTKQIKIPLIIKNCPFNSLIDFDSFYRKMVEINFNIKEQALSFCQCGDCYRNPIKYYKKSIFYHEAYGEALSEFNKSNVKVPSFLYDFSTKRVLLKLRKD